MLRVFDWQLGLVSLDMGVVRPQSSCSARIHDRQPHEGHGGLLGGLCEDGTRGAQSSRLDTWTRAMSWLKWLRRVRNHEQRACDRLVRAVRLLPGSVLLLERPENG